MRDNSRPGTCGLRRPFNPPSLPPKRNKSLRRKTSRDRPSLPFAEMRRKYVRICPENVNELIFERDSNYKNGFQKYVYGIHV